MRQINFIILLFFILLMWAPNAHAECEIISVEGATLTPTGCTYLNPFDHWEKFDEKFELHNISDEQKKEILEGYYGAIISMQDELKTEEDCETDKPCLSPAVNYFYTTKERSICQNIALNVPQKVSVANSCCTKDDVIAPCWMDIEHVVVTLSRLNDYTCRDNSECYLVNNYEEPVGDFPGETWIACRHVNIPLKKGEWFEQYNQYTMSKCKCSQTTKECVLE